MANGQEILTALSELGFGNVGAFHYSAWKGYAVSLRRITAKNFFADVAVRLDKIPGTLRKALAAAVKPYGIKISGSAAITRTTVSFNFTTGKNPDAKAELTEKLDAIAAALRDNAITPADTSALSGAAMPDSLCLVPTGNLITYQPVRAEEIRQQNAKLQEKAEDNEQNGSYGLGFVGALLGALVGLIPSVLLAFFADLISAWLFALVPICSMFGYKLFKGKMGKPAIAIVILMSLLAALVIPYVSVVAACVHELGDPLGLAMAEAFDYLRDPDVLQGILGIFLKILLFAGLGVFLGWSFLGRQTNSAVLKNAEEMTATLRPNPNVQTPDEFGQTTNEIL